MSVTFNQQFLSNKDGTSFGGIFTVTFRADIFWTSVQYHCAISVDAWKDFILSPLYDVTFDLVSYDGNVWHVQGVIVLDENKHHVSCDLFEAGSDVNNLDAILRQDLFVRVARILFTTDVKQEVLDELSGSLNMKLSLLKDAKEAL